MTFDRQEAKIQAQQKERDQLREQLSLNNDENQLKQTIQVLNEQLTKQQALNRLQASQILDFEQKLWQANKQRDEAENSLTEIRSAQSAPTPDDNVNLNFNQELRVKQVQVRDLQDKIEMYQGRASVINHFSRSQLTTLHDELN